MQDKELQVKSTAQMLEEGLSEVFSSAYYRRFLAFIANNPNYSYRNVILILQQCPHATRTMGFKSWLREERAVKAGERGLRINALFEKDDEKDQPPKPSSKRKHKRDSGFRRISVFDISQTAPLDGSEDAEANRPAPMPAVNPFEVARLEGSVPGYQTLIEDLRGVSPLPISFKSGVKMDGGNGPDGIVINRDISQLHTIRTIANQIARIWIRWKCPDSEQLEIQSESIAFIVCRALGLDTSAFSFQHIAAYSIGRERNALERFLDVIQKTALYFIDTLDGIRAARRISYQTDEYFLFTNKKTAFRLFRQGHFIYLVYPGQGELLVMNKKALEQYDGPFAVPRGDWFGVSRQMAA